jgi:hypothetical protein
MRGPAVVFVILVASCGGQSAPNAPVGGVGAPTAAQNGPPSGGGDAARIICEAECRRGARCAGGRSSEDPRACAARCATLPVRMPPVWQTAWAGTYARCADESTCATDDDERCLFMFMVQQPPNDAVQACLAAGPPDQRDVRTKSGRKCLVLSGLTPGASAQAAACLRSGADGKSCMPPFDWK